MPLSIAAKKWDAIKAEVQAEMSKDKPCIKIVNQLMDKARGLKPKMRLQERKDRNLQ